jgi:hypothetical protein
MQASLGRRESRALPRSPAKPPPRCANKLGSIPPSSPYPHNQGELEETSPAAPLLGSMDGLGPSGQVYALPRAGGKPTRSPSDRLMPQEQVQVF